MANNAVFYHDKCVDGLVAVSTYYRHFPEGFYQGVQYRGVPNLLDFYDKVVFLDFSPPADWVKVNRHFIDKLLIIDHHKSAEKEVEEIRSLLSPDKLEVVFDLNKSGGLLTWEKYEGEDIPPLIQIAADYDLGKDMPKFEGFVDIFAAFLEGEDHVRFPDFYTYVSQREVEGLENEYRKCHFVNTQRDQKIRWFENRLKYHKATLSWLPGSPTIEIAYTYCPQYLITSFSKTVLANNPRINLVLGASLNNNSMGFSFRGRGGENFARLIAERFRGGGHDSAAGGVLNEVMGYYSLNNLIERGGPNQ